MNLHSRITDMLERSLRNPRVTHIQSLTAGALVTGIITGILAYGLTKVAFTFSLPIAYLAITAGIVAITYIFDKIGEKLEEPVGDQSSRILTRIRGWRWIPFQERPPLHVRCEPWRTSLVVTILILSFSDLSPEPKLFPEATLWHVTSAIIVGMISAQIRWLTLRTTWRALIKNR